MENKVWSNVIYDKISPFYDLFLGIVLPKKFRKKVIENCKKGKILDVACGTGELLKYSEQKGFKCYGIDLSSGMLNQAIKKIKNVELKQANYYNIPYKNNTFENVVSTYALGGTKIDVPKVISEMIRVCKPSGKVIILDWQKKQKENIIDKIFIKIAKLTEDTPKNFIGIFLKFGYNAECIKLSNTCSIISIIKKS